MSTPTPSRRFETLAVHSGERRPGPQGSLVFPIYQATVYSVEPGTGYHDQQYIRLNSTPSQVYLHEKLAALEGAEAAVATASGMAALSATMLTLLHQGDHFLAAGCLYGGSHDLIAHYAKALGLSWTFVDTQDPDTWTAALTPRTRMFHLEAIANPLMRVPRLKEAVAFCRRHDLVSLIDSTFASPVNLQPLSLGIDLVFHSATKYLNGHSDLAAGCVMGSTKMIEEIRRTMNHFGGTLDPHAGFLLARGIKTLALRVKAANANGLALARFLSTHPKVREVNYPGLEDHPDHGHARELLSGFSGMLSLRLKGGAPAARRLIESVRLPYPAPSLGGVESLITQPALTSHAGMSPEERERVGVTEDLVRVSCGIEHAEDLVEDFRQALDRV